MEEKMDLADAFMRKIKGLEAAGMTPGEMAERLDVSPSTISRWLNEGVKIENIKLRQYVAVMGYLPKVPESEEEYAAKAPSSEVTLSDCHRLVDMMAVKKRWRSLTGVHELLSALAMPERGKEDR